MLEKIPPMLLEKCQSPFDSEDFVFEFKLDGVRMLCDLRNQNPVLYNRSLNERTSLYPEIKSSLSLLPKGCVFDGEIIAQNLLTGKQDFYALLSRDSSASPKPLVNHSLLFGIFDILYFEGDSVMHLSLTKRKLLLKDALANARGAIQAVDSFDCVGTLLYETAKSNGLEGIVAKKKDSPYLAGQRSHHWQKIKCERFLEAYICGFVIKPTRISLCLGIPKGDKFHYIGNVSNGLSQSEWLQLEKTLAALITEASSFDKSFTEKNAVFVKPHIKLVAKFLEQAEDGKLRQPIISRLIY